MFKIIKRDGRETAYDIAKIERAIEKAMMSSGQKDAEESKRLAKIAEEMLSARFASANPTVEDIQDIVENVLMQTGYEAVAKKYILYRAERTRVREMNSKLMRIYEELTNTAAGDSDIKRDNANIDGDTAMGTMLKYGSEGAKDYYEKSILTKEQREAHRDGDIHIHDFDFYTLTTTCCQIDLVKLFKGGFSTGHGYLREPNDIQSYSALACIAIQSNQNDQHGGQSVPNFDYGLAEGVKKTYKKFYAANFLKAVRIIDPARKLSLEEVKNTFKRIENEQGIIPQLAENKALPGAIREYFKELLPLDIIEKAIPFAKEFAESETERATFQAMEALIHNLNTMHSRAGAQTPFSSINYGMDVSPEGRMVIRNILLSLEAGLGFGETPIFPIHIFRLKEGVNFNEGDPNYDLFLLAMKVSAKRLFPNFSFVDAPFNLQYYKEGHPETEVAYMGCRTRVIGNTYDPNNEITYGRGNLSFTSINLPRIAINSKGNTELFFTELQGKMDLCVKQLLDRFAIQCTKRVRNFPFLMGQGVWIDSEKLSVDDSIREVLKHGTLSIGFIGLAEALVALIGKHHGEDGAARKLGLQIVRFMRDYTDRMSSEHNLNFTLIATPAEGLSGRFVRIDRKKYGEIKGVTDRDYYTNSFHVPVYYPITAYDKIQVEAPYHALTNAGHITYVELDGDTANNLEAFEKIIRAMKDAGIGYGSINHPVDRDSECGYSGIIGGECPKCGRKEGESGLPFERIRRITGYLVGTLDRFNNAKKAEEKDRVKHGV